MTTPMLDNFLAAFKGQEPSPLYGLPLVYLPDAAKARALPGSFVVGKIEPLVTENTAVEVSMFSDTVTAQFESAGRLGFKHVVLTDVESFGLGGVMARITEAHAFGVGVVVKNPTSVQEMAHGNTTGAIIAPGTGPGPRWYAELRTKARKDGKLPMWFVFDGESTGPAEATEEIRKYRLFGVGVSTASVRDSYSDSTQVLLPFTQ